MRRLRWLVLVVVVVVFSAVLLGACGGAAHTRYSRGALTVDAFTRDQANAHVVRQGDAGFLFDTGYQANADALAEDLKAAGLEPSQLRAIIISHGHADHAGAAKALHERFQVPVLVGAGDEATFASGKHDQPFCPTGLIGRVRQSGDEGASYTGSTADLLVSAPMDLEPLTGIAGQLVPLPGHTKGSLVVVVGDVALVGDLFRGSAVGSGAATHLYMCDLEGNRRDIAHLMKDLAPDAGLVFTGHFGPVSRQAVLDEFDAR